MATHHTYNPSSRPSHYPADPTASSSSSRETSDDRQFRPTSTESGTPLAAALQLEKPLSHDDQHEQAGRTPAGTKKFHIKSFQEVRDENLAKAEARAGKRDPWITRKFAIG